MVSGYVPVLKSVLNNKSYADFLNSANGGDKIAALSAKVCLEQEQSYYTSPAFTGSSKARDEVGLLLTKILLFLISFDILLRVSSSKVFDK